MKVLAGDIGGSNTRLAIFSGSSEAPRLELERTYRSGEYADLETIVETFLDRHGDPREECAAASFGIAGPVRRGRVKTTNLPWVVEAGRIAEVTGLPRVALINDLEANAYGLEALGPEDYFVLAAGEAEPRGNRALVSAGTGLGEAGMVWEEGGYRPFATEGGHADFAPSDELEVALLRFSWRRYGSHVSWERLVSGPGIVTLFEFLCSYRGFDTPASLRQEMEAGDPAAAISRAALAGSSQACVETMRLFVRLYAAEAGNAALKLLATGGVYLGGGIAPKILDLLRAPEFLATFRDKGRMRPVLEAMPIRVVLNEGTALLGAARHAALGLGSGNP